MGLIGKPVKRVDGVKYVTGRAQYIADLKFVGMVELAIIRSRHGHARIGGIDISQALQHPGTLAIVTARDLQSAVQPISASVDREGFRSTEVYPLARDKVRYVGEPVAAVVARDRYVAEDIAELVMESLEK